jgi:hypothetical protein
MFACSCCGKKLSGSKLDTQEGEDGAMLCAGCYAETEEETA